MSKPYHYIRFNWLREVNLDEVKKELVESFIVEERPPTTDDRWICLFKDENRELKVKADTLTAFLSPLKVVIFQRNPAPFTARDMELRKKLAELYPRERPTPFPFMFSTEPKFDVADEK